MSEWLNKRTTRSWLCRKSWSLILPSTKTLGGVFLTTIFSLVCGNFKKTNFQKFKCPEQRSVQEGRGGGVCWKEGVEASNCLKQLSTSICWPQWEKYLIVFASEARPTFSTVMQADMEKEKTSK